MYCNLIGTVIATLILTAILAGLLQIASRIVLKEAIEFGDAFKAAFVASVLCGISYWGLDNMFDMEEQRALLLISRLVVTYVIWVLALSVIIDLTLGESLLVGAVFTAIFVVLTFILLAIAVAIAPSAAK